MDTGDCFTIFSRRSLTLLFTVTSQETLQVYNYGIPEGCTCSKLTLETLKKEVKYV